MPFRFWSEIFHNLECHSCGWQTNQMTHIGDDDVCIIQDNSLHYGNANRSREDRNNVEGKRNAVVKNSHFGVLFHSPKFLFLLPDKLIAPCKLVPLGAVQSICRCIMQRNSSSFVTRNGFFLAHFFPSNNASQPKD